MEKPTNYCDAILQMEKDNVHVHYHNLEYGFPIHRRQRIVCQAGP